MLTREQIEQMQVSLEAQAAQLHEQLHKTLGALDLCQHWLQETETNNPVTLEQKEAGD